MNSYPDANTNLTFSIETIMVNNGKKNKLTTDANGYYLFPVMALKQESSNNTYYDSDSFSKIITKSTFRDRLESGCLYGEWGHPDFSQYKDKRESFSRLIKIDEDRVSHHIKGLSVENNIVEASLKPCGPYGKYLEESLDTPTINTAFSLRSLAKETRIKSPKTNKDIICKDIMHLTTFDYVLNPGFKEATKRFARSVEGKDDTSIEIKNEDMSYHLSLENIDDGYLNDIFSTNEITKIKKSLTINSSRISDMLIKNSSFNY